MADAVLGIETSCDETSAAVLVNGELSSLVILSQDIHKVFGGVVPELASRAHLAALPAVVDRDLSGTGAQFTIRVGAYVQTLEIGGVEVRRFAPGTDIKSLPRTSNWA